MKLILLRHGQSQWNLENKFAGWTDIPITEEGKRQAKEAAKSLHGIKIDIAYTSKLQRASETLRIVLQEMGLGIKTIESIELNERHYGKLQGINREEAKKEFGEEQVHEWRRSYDITPPEGESLKDVVKRVVPYYEKEILPKLKEGKNVIVVAHGNSLRALIKHLENISDVEIMKVEIPLCIPLIYDINESGDVMNKGSF